MDHLCFFLSCVCYAFVHVFCALSSPAGKVLTSWLSLWCISVSMPLSHWYPGSVVVLVVSIPDLCTLSYFAHKLPFKSIIRTQYFDSI